MASRFIEMRNQRLKKLRKFQELGINPYPSQSKKDEDNQTVIDNFDQYKGKEITLAGRLMSWREHGKVVFGDIQDQSGKIQAVFKEGELTETSKETQTIGFSDLSLIDIGDFIQVTGQIDKTKTGAISTIVSSLTILTKSIRPLPEKRLGLKDPEIIFRRRYLDLTMSLEKREMFIRKSKFWAANRKFMIDNGFIEVETPILEHVTGGADAKPFTTHHHALDEDFFLRISPELQLKRLIGGGFEKVFNLGPNFRNEGIDDEHLQEYYQCEWYWAYANYRDNMKLVKEMFRYVAKEVYGKTKFMRGEHTFDLADEWEEIDYIRVIKEKFDIDIFKDSEDKMLDILKNEGIKISGEINRNRLVDNLWKVIRKNISGPAFLINEPKFMSPLAKSKPNNKDLTERFHIVIAGSELGNGYSELNDPADQLERFLEQQEARDAGDDEAQMLDIDYVEMLEYGMPPTSGYAHSERLFWFLENVTAREGTLFPQMKRHIGASTRSMYNLKKSGSDEATKKYNYQARKIVAIVDKNLEKWKIANALGHMAFSAGNKSDSSWMGREKLTDADGDKHTGIAKHPFVVLQAYTDEIRKIRNEAIQESEIFIIDYPSEMFEEGHDDKLSRAMAKKKESEFIYHGLLLAGSSDKISELTKKLELFEAKDFPSTKAPRKLTNTGAHTFSISTEVQEKFPGFSYAVTTIEGVNIQKSNKELRKLTQDIINANTLDLENIAEMDTIEAYRKVFKDTGAWKLSRRPSPEALLRRISQGKGIYNVNTAVDAYNLAVIETRIGLGGFNAEKISGNVTLRFTKDGEQMLLLGDDNPTKTFTGEIAYADDEKLLTLDLNYRDINETKITSKTENIMLFADGAPGISEDKVVKALEKGANYIQQFCGGKIGKIQIVR